MDKIDALAASLDRSRNYIVNQALELYLEVNAWQVDRIKSSLEAAEAGRIQPAEDVFDRISGRHGWSR